MCINYLLITCFKDKIASYITHLPIYQLAVHQLTHISMQAGIMCLPEILINNDNKVINKNNTYYTSSVVLAK